MPAYESQQFITGECFGSGWVPSLPRVGFLARFVYFIQPMKAMPVLAPKV